MPKKLRVFISSTMTDLANERQEIVRQIESLGLEAVYAEDLLPSGESSWKLLEEEILSSDIFLLVLGERYGWVPTSGPGAGTGKSVTHLEYDQARSNNIPIMPFTKKLDYKTVSRSKDAKQRDKFRNEVGAWETGLFRADFDLAHDLGVKVREGLMEVFVDSFLKKVIQASEASHSTKVALPIISEDQLTPKTVRNSAVLLAGAGMSISAGYPSASVLAELLGRQLGFSADGATILSRYSFVDLALLAEERLGRNRVIEIVLELMNTAIPVEPTIAHTLAVLKFQAIVTTNYDTLFEDACKTKGLPFTVKTARDSAQSKSGVIDIFKIDGSVEDPVSLVFTPDDHANVQAASSFWNEIDGLMQVCEVTIVGHSIRDPSSRRLLQNRNSGMKGVYVSPYLDELDAILLNRFKLTGVKSNADDFLAGTSYTTAVNAPYGSVRSSKV